MSLKRSIGRLGARVGGNQELIEGVLDGIDPALLAEIINGNTAFMVEVVSNIDVPVLLRSLDKKVMKEIISFRSILPVETVRRNTFTTKHGSISTCVKTATATATPSDTI